MFSSYFRSDNDNNKGIINYIFIINNHHHHYYYHYHYYYQEQWDTLNIASGDDVPDANKYKGLVLTGSRFNTRDALPWYYYYHYY